MNDDLIPNQEPLSSRGGCHKFNLGVGWGGAARSGDGKGRSRRHQLEAARFESSAEEKPEQRAPRTLRPEGTRGGHRLNKGDNRNLKNTLISQRPYGKIICFSLRLSLRLPLKGRCCPSGFFHEPP